MASAIYARLPALEAQPPISLSRLGARITRLEAQAQGTDASLGQGLAALLAYAERHPPTKDPDAALEDLVADLTAQVAAGARGCTPLLLEALEKERARRQAAVAAVHARGEADPCESRKDLEEARPYA